MSSSPCSLMIRVCKLGWDLREQCVNNRKSGSGGSGGARTSSQHKTPAHNTQKNLFLLQTSRFSGGSLGMRKIRRQGATTTVAKKERVGLSI